MFDWHLPPSPVSNVAPVGGTNYTYTALRKENLLSFIVDCFLDQVFPLESASDETLLS